MDYNMQTSMDGSPFMTGSWYNPKTGDSFTVRDTYMEDNNLFVMTTDGRRMDYNMVSQYVQTDKPLPKQPQNNNTPAKNVDDIPPEVRAIMAETGDADLLNKPIHSTASTPQAPVHQNIYKEPEPVDEDALLIKRMLGRGAAPEITCGIQWLNFPVKQMDMLDTMAVDPAKIAEFYISKIDIDAIRQQIANEITFYIESKLNGTGEPVAEVQTAQEPAELHQEFAVPTAVEPKKVETKKAETKKTTKTAAKKTKK